MGNEATVRECVNALTAVAESHALTPEVRIQAVRTLAQHWPQARPVLQRIARECPVAEVAAAARGVLAAHDST